MVLLEAGWGENYELFFPAFAPWYLKAEPSITHAKKKKIISLSTHWWAYNVGNSIKPRLKAILRASIFLPEAVASPTP